MDNDKLLREISAALETMAGKIDTALAGVSDDRLKCNSGSCPHYAGGGRCTATDKCVLARSDAEAITHCNEPCINNKCEFRDDDDTCMGLTVCVDQIRPSPAAPCCTKSSPCEKHVPVEELLQGYTLAQWDEIRKGGYLCEFGSGNGAWLHVGYLSTIQPERPKFLCNPAASDNVALNSFPDCRPAQIPGVLRPWFGGDCPVSNGVTVLVKFRDGGHDLTVATNLEWDREIDTGGDIIAYMEV